MDKPGYVKDLEKAGVQEKDAVACMKWAFGEFWDMIDVRLIHLSFNTFHSDLPELTPDMTIEQGLGKIGTYWLKLQKEAA